MEDGRRDHFTVEMFGGNTRGKYWVTEPDAYLEPRGVNDIGGGGETPRTIIDCFQNTVEKFGDRNALALKRETLGKNFFLFIYLAFLYFRRKR